MEEWEWLREFLEPLREWLAVGWSSILALLPSSESAPAWVQAVGSILAILVAISVANRQSRDALGLARRIEAKAEEEKAVRGSAFAIFLVPHAHQHGGAGGTC